jgi:hypothetical protein
MRTQASKLCRGVAQALVVVEQESVRRMEYLTDPLDLD